ncbi:anti-sigma factor domain-containing protein [Brassicibacter mesophilus]|uniref:anti-sigma factor domain-containing protein n=1 Tax=Brassicibacter mesophilus TaxID=745119 RepID=UPI003D1DF025
MRGIVMDKNNNKIIVLTDNGQFLEIKNFNKSIQIGQEVNFNNNSIYSQNFIKKAISIAAVFLAMITGGYGVYGYYMPFGYVDVDINPSVELSYNLYDRVIDIKGLNEDGTHIIEKIDSYKNKPVKDIITKVIDRAIEEKYIKSDEQNAILVTITEAGSKIDDKEIFQSVDNHMKEEKLETEVVLVKSDKNEYEAAKKNNISPGKQMLINKALKSSDKTNQEDMQNKSVKEIMNIIKESKKEDKKEYKEDKFDTKYQNSDYKENKQNKQNKHNNVKTNVNSKNPNYLKESFKEDNEDDNYEDSRKDIKDNESDKNNKNNKNDNNRDNNNNRNNNNKNNNDDKDDEDNKNNKSNKKDEDDKDDANDKDDEADRNNKNNKNNKNYNKNNIKNRNNKNAKNDEDD